MKILENVPLAPLTTLKVGGPARFFGRADSEADVLHALEHAEARGLEVFVLGGGSNILVSDRGFDGLVLQIALRGVSFDGEVVTAQAGEDWDPLVETCVSRDLAGIECLSGIPGYVGGTPVQNVGAYGQDVSKTIVSVRCLERDSRKIVDLANAECGFTYRRSIFNSDARDEYIVLAVKFRLVSGGKPMIGYKDLQRYFDGREPSLRDVREGVLAIRRSKSMVIEPDDPNSRSAGSFFKNPIVDVSKFESIRAEQPSDVPHFSADHNMVKIPAAWLIEQSGFHKGFCLRNAGISENHSLAIINRGNATAAEIVELKEKIQDAVEKKFGIILQPEPIFVGFDR